MNTNYYQGIRREIYFVAGDSSSFTKADWKADITGHTHLITQMDGS